ncbi:MAG: hypothetical protein HFG22_16965 [Lachnospiraceae bacterium]|nr:hypothetical protein [Lachnospiraceae bacterium]
MKRIGIVLLAVCAAGWLAGCGAAAALTMAKAENGCQVVDCDRKVYEDGLCRRHHRMAERGETLELKADQTAGWAETADPRAGEETGEIGAGKDDALSEGTGGNTGAGKDKDPLEERTGAADDGVAAGDGYGPAAERTERAGTAMGGTAKTREEEIQYIRDTYAYANAHLADLRKEKGYVSDYGITFDDGESYYDRQGDLIKQVRPRDMDVAVESYHINPALGRDLPAEGGRYLDTTVVFAFATDAAGGEYRLYFSNGHVIRYIGPDKKVIDYPYPEGIDWLTFSRAGETLSGGDQIGPILSKISPMWHVAFEMSEGDLEDEPSQEMEPSQGSQPPSSSSQGSWPSRQSAASVAEDLTDADKAALEAILAREFYHQWDRGQKITVLEPPITKAEVQYAAWDYMFYDYHEDHLILPENPDPQWGINAPSVYYDRGKVNTMIEDIYGVVDAFWPGERCYYGADSTEPYLIVEGERITTPFYYGNGGDPWAIVTITDYSYHDGYMGVSGWLTIDSNGGVIVEDAKVAATFRVNVDRHFPFRLSSVQATLQ